MTRATAKVANLPFYFNGIPCLRGHIGERRTASGQCVTCRKIMPRKRYKYPRKKFADLPLEQKARHKATAKKWRESNPGANSRSALAWAKANPARKAENNAAYSKRYPEKTRATRMLRIATTLRATPRWADIAAIKAIYAECVQTQNRTGVKHEVDHIVPLRGRTVCGLHVHWNLQILSRTENRKKWIKFSHEFINEARPVR